MVMKKKLLIGAIVLGLCGTAVALDPMGPPAAGLSQGQWSVGAEYSYSEMNLYREKTYYSNKAYLNTRMNKAYARVGYGVKNNWEAFVRLGISDLDYARGAGSGEWSGNDNGTLAFGLGTKTTFSQNDNVTWGGLAQMNWAQFSGQRENPGASSEQTGSFETDITEFQLAVGPTWTPQEGISIYGGPFLHFVNGRHSHRHSSGTGDYGIHEQTNFGGYIGTQIELADNTSFYVEWQKTDDADALAGGVIWKY